jgi:hypothetical protein
MGRHYWRGHLRGRRRARGPASAESGGRFSSVGVRRRGRRGGGERGRGLFMGRRRPRPGRVWGRGPARGPTGESVGAAGRGAVGAGRGPGVGRPPRPTGWRGRGVSTAAVMRGRCAGRVLRASLGETWRVRTSKVEAAARRGAVRLGGDAGGGWYRLGRRARQPGGRTARQRRCDYRWRVKRPRRPGAGGAGQAGVMCGRLRGGGRAGNARARAGAAGAGAPGRDGSVGALGPPC